MINFTYFKTGLAVASLLVASALFSPFTYAAPKDLSDLNSDDVVDFEDLKIFSTNYLETNWETVDWCLFYDNTMAGEPYEGQSTGYYLKRFKLLLTFIRDFEEVVTTQFCSNWKTSQGFCFAPQSPGTEVAIYTSPTPRWARCIFMIPACI
jgi:hypothetical protein